MVVWPFFLLSFCFTFNWLALSFQFRIYFYFKSISDHQTYLLFGDLLVTRF